MADDKKDDKGDKGKGGEGGGDGGLKRLKAALAGRGIMIPDAANSLDEISLVVEGLAANDGGAGGGDDLNDDDFDDVNRAQDNMTDAAITPAMLSGLPKTLATAFNRQVEDERASLLRMVGAVEKRGVPKLVTQERLNQIRDSITKADAGVMLSSAGGENKSRAIFELRTLARAVGYKGKPGTNLSGGNPVDRTEGVDIGDPRPQHAQGATKAQIDAVTQRVMDRAEGKAPPMPT